MTFPESRRPFISTTVTTIPYQQQKYSPLHFQSYFCDSLGISLIFFWNSLTPLEFFGDYIEMRFLFPRDSLGILLGFLAIDLKFYWDLLSNVREIFFISFIVGFHHFLFSFLLLFCGSSFPTLFCFSFIYSWFFF